MPKPSTPQQSPRTSAASPGVVALMSWLWPGAGYWMIGERTRGLTIGITVLAVFVLGLLIAGVRVIEVPGWDASGRAMLVRSNAPPSMMDSVVFRRPISEIASKPWFVPQMFVGLPIIAASAWSINEAGQVAKPHARLAEIGTLYTAVAGMLNVLAGIDAAYRASEGKTK